MAEEQESAHGKLSPTDQAWNAPRFLVLLTATLTVALAVIYTIASIKYGDFSWHPLAHDPVRHTFESSTIGH